MLATMNKTSDTRRDLNDNERAAEITKAIRAADKDLRRRFPVLNYQSALGVAFFGAAVAVSVVSAVAYGVGVMPWYLCLAINAICFAVIREIEHDLIHNLYFATNKRIQDTMMLAVWPFLGNLPHPWYRRRMHLLHHRTSGHDEDFEEQLIGNGLPFGAMKLLAMFEPGLASLFRQREFAQIPFYKAREFYKALFPVGTVYLVAIYGWALLHLATLAVGLLGGSMPETLAGVRQVLNVVAVVWVLPNMLRQVCLQIISSNMHYFGDVENRLQETQVFNAWWLAPLNLFTCNFGATHSIHHFVVNQPFYLRQMVAGTAHAAFRRYGVRYNDAATILRGNRFQK
jgi:fatty acid desaturase